MDRREFEKNTELAFEKLPETFREAIENVGVVIEDYPDEDLVQKMHLRSRYQLLGLYQGIPLPHRNSWYGMSPVTPDKISLYQKNIEAVCHSEQEVIDKIHEVLIHEIGHYFGMNEDEIRAAGF